MPPLTCYDVINGNKYSLQITTSLHMFSQVGECCFGTVLSQRIEMRFYEAKDVCICRMETQEWILRPFSCKLNLMFTEWG